MLFEKSPGQNLKWKLIGLAGSFLIDLLLAPSKITVKGRQPIEHLLASQKYILAFWHGRIVLVSYAHKKWGGAALVSDSADGEIIAQVLQRQGHMTVRGSTSKGGARAIAKIIKGMRTETRPVAVVPDGPQGPREKVQPGVVYLASKTGYPIVPATYSARRRWVFGSWDRFILPYPASPCILVYGQPLHIPPNSDPQQIDHYAQRLEEELARITAEADSHFGHAPVA